MFHRKQSHLIWLAIALLLGSALACNLSPTPAPDAPSASSEPVQPTAEPNAAAPTEASDGPPQPPVSSPTPVPDVSAGGCTLNAAYVADVTIPDGTEIPAEKPFTKRWRLRNTGTCAWKPGTKLTFVSGDQMGGPTELPIQPVAPDGGTVLGIDLTAPAAPGTYKGNWQLKAPDGTAYGSVIYVQIVVPGSGPSPSATPGGPTATPAPTSGATPDLRVSAIGFNPSIGVTGTPFHVMAVLHNDGSQALTNVTVRVEQHHNSGSCDDMGMVNTLHETTVDLDAGQSLPVDYTATINDAWEHIICVRIDSDDDVAESDEGNNVEGDTLLVGNLTTIQLEANNSGSSGHNQARPGDDPSDQRVVGYLSWDLSVLPSGAQILSASLHWASQCFQGGDVGDCSGNRDPFPALGNLEVKHYYYGTLGSPPPVMLNPNLITPLATYATNPSDVLDVTDAVANDVDSGRPFQLRLAFENTTDNNGIGNGVTFPEGNGPNTLEIIHMP